MSVFSLSALIAYDPVGRNYILIRSTSALLRCRLIVFRYGSCAFLTLDPSMCAQDFGATYNYRGIVLIVMNLFAFFWVGIGNATRNLQVLHEMC